MRHLFVGTIGILLGAFLTLSLPGYSANNDTYRQLDLFGNVFERIHTDYVSDVEDQELIEAAINGMLASLDPHSSYLSPDSYGDFQEQISGEFGGLGIEVSMEEGLVKVVAPIDDTPAARAGIQSGDLISFIDDEPIRGLTLNQAVEKMRGAPNTDIKITVIRKGTPEPFDVTITRAIIKVQSVRYRREGDVAYVRITTFNQQTDRGLEKGLKKLKKEIGDQLRGVVIDLRNNPGGSLDQAINVSDFFLDDGAIVSTRGRDNRDSQRFTAKSGDLVNGLPVIVLINGGSASASEIVAGALQDHRRATVLGTKSFGKGSVQTMIPLAAGRDGALKLTTAKYYTPSGRSIQAVGITPDFIVEQYDPSGKPRRALPTEADLRNALPAEEREAAEDAAEGENEASEIPEDLIVLERPLDDKIKDYQLARALEILNGIPLQAAAN